ncbi:MAG: BREX system ATP-binding domain-containing protein [Dehalococcoidia bacterium]
MEQYEARRIVETLRAGVPSREVSRILLAGRDEQLDRCKKDMNQVSVDGRSRYFLIYSAYGGGKTHFLSALANSALENGFAVSQLVLSKETPFNRINKVYEATAHAVELPDYPRTGFEEALMRIRPESDIYYDLRDDIESSLHPKLSFVFQNYFREGDFTKRSQIYEDLAGSFFSMSTLRAIHRSNFGESIRMERFLLSQHTHNYFRFLSKLIRRLGYKGWVILLDEAELLAKLGIAGRAQAYVNLGRLFGFDVESAVDGMYVVCAFNTAFREDRLLGKNGDVHNAPGWLDKKRRNSDAEIAKRTLDALINEGIHLPAITRDMAGGILKELERLHGTAYDWETRMNRDQILDWTGTTLTQGSVRTTILAAMEDMDVRYQEGNGQVDLYFASPDEGTFEEDSAYFQSKDEPPDYS